MKNITTFLFFVFTMLAQNAAAQGSFVYTYLPDTSILVQKPSIFYDVIQTPDTGYLVVGGKNTIGSSSTAKAAIVLKMNPMGQPIWTKEIIFPNNNNAVIQFRNMVFTQISLLDDGNYLLVGDYKHAEWRIGNPPLYNYLYKISPDGIILWESQQQIDGTNTSTRVFLANDNNILHITQKYFNKINRNTGQEMWRRITPIRDSFYYFVGGPTAVNTCTNGFLVARSDSSIVKYNENGDTLQLIKANPFFPSPTPFAFKQSIDAVMEMSNGDISVLAYDDSLSLYKFSNDFSFISKKNLGIIKDITMSSAAPIFRNNAEISLLVRYSCTSPFRCAYKINHFDNNGILQTISSEITYPYFPKTSYLHYNQLKPTTDGGFVTLGFLTGNYTQGTIVKINPQGYSLKKLPVKIYTDTNLNCTKDANEAYKSPISLNLKLKSRESGQTMSVQTDGQGNYWFYVNDQTFDVKTNLNTLWRICGDSVHFTDLSGNADTLLLGIQAAQPCSALEVNIGNDRMRRCVGNTYDLRYYNSGTIASLNAYIDLKLDDFLTFDSASVAALPLGNHTYRFAVGSVESLESGSLKVHFTVNCNSTIGQMHCTDALIRPYLECIGNKLWDGSQIQVTAECDAPHHAARFFIKNIGTGDMATARNWGVIEDDIMGRDSLYFLRAGATDTIRIDSVDSDVVYRIIVEQDPNHPAATVATAVLWCANTVHTHWQFVNQLAQDDGAAYTATNCTINRDSYDPNEKSVTPEGVGEQHAIPKNTPLEYKIQFQNTGNDTAYLVRIHDQLSANLDWKTLKTGASSHPYTYTLDSAGLLIFTFSTINLLDSLHNEPKSHGFVQFTIRQKTDLAVGASIENTARIYFDNNPPIITNTVSQTIGVRWATIVKQPTPPTIPIPSVLNVALVYPNPFSETCHFVLKNTEGKLAKTETASLRITDILGHVLLEKVFTNGQASIAHSEIDLATGLVFYQINVDGRVWSTGKLLIVE